LYTFITEKAVYAQVIFW